MPFKECFSGKKVIITGTGQGLGRALAKRLYDYGATVYALSKTAERLETLKAECPNMNTICVDLTDWDASRQVVSAIGPVDHLVNNAISYEPGHFLDITPQDFDSMMNIGLKSYLNVSQVVAKGMIDAGIKGSIVNMSSLAGIRPFPTICGYSMVKASLNMLTKLMAVDLGPHGIRVNALCTTGIDTEALERFFDTAATLSGVDAQSVKDAVNAKTPIGKFTMTLDEGVNSVLFPLSNLSPHLHGECIIVDGGYSLT